jgi:hypothetical protein
VTRKTYGICTVVALIALTATVVLAEGLDSNVVAIDQKKHQLSLDWLNDTTKVVLWNAETKFTVLETGAASKPAEIHVGSYLRIKGEERDGVFVAAEITIWLAESKPAPAPK